MSRVGGEAGAAVLVIAGRSIDIDTAVATAHAYPMVTVARLRPARTRTRRGDHRRRDRPHPQGALPTGSVITPARQMRVSSAWSAAVIAEGGRHRSACPGAGRPVRLGVRGEMRRSASTDADSGSCAGLGTPARRRCRCHSLSNPPGLRIACLTPGVRFSYPAGQVSSRCCRVGGMLCGAYEYAQASLRIESFSVRRIRIGIQLQTSQ